MACQQVTSVQAEDSDTDSDSETPPLSEFSEADQKEFIEEIKNMEKKVSILCCGPVGVGKSALLNGLMGQEETEWCNEFCVRDSLKDHSCLIMEKTFQKDGIAVTVWDTPGLSGGKDDKNTLQEIKMKCADFDLFLYCIDIMETRATDLFDEKSTLRKFTDLFGAKKLWENAVVVLTKANGFVQELEDESMDSNILEEKFKEKVSQWKKKVRLEIGNLGYNKAKKVPVLPAGNSIRPSLPGYPHWLGKIFEKAVDRMKDKARIAYLSMSNDRLVNPDEVNEDDLSDKPIHTQPFVVPKKYKIAAAVGVSGAGVTSAAVGAGVGATIGALLIGIPSFGVFAAGGLVLGGAIGAGVGFGASLATGLAARHFMKKRQKKKK